MIIVFSGMAISLNAQKSKSLNYIDNRISKIPDSLTYDVQSIANFINAEFTTDFEKSRSIYCWITQNIQYDFLNRYSIDLESGNENDFERLLQTRKGVCNHYANLYSAIANKVNIKTFVVIGYTRKRNIHYNPHAWCVSLIDSVWYCTDPTWGAGYVDNKDFIKSISNKYFMMEPSKFVKTHIPFDPLWQLSHYPLSKFEFAAGYKISRNRKHKFDYIFFLDQFENQNEIERMLSTKKRIELNGVSNYLDYVNLYHLNAKIIRNYKLKAEEKFNTALSHYNDAIFLLNEYIEYRNKYYLPYKSDNEIKKLLTNVENELIISLNRLDEIEHRSQIMNQRIAQIKKIIRQALNDVYFQQEKLDKYLETAKEYRKNMAKNNE